MRCARTVSCLLISKLGEIEGIFPPPRFASRRGLQRPGSGESQRGAVWPGGNSRVDAFCVWSRADGIEPHAKRESVAWLRTRCFSAPACHPFRLGTQHPWLILSNFWPDFTRFKTARRPSPTREARVTCRQIGNYLQDVACRH